jgi:hypothetical protein
MYRVKNFYKGDPHWTTAKFPGRCTRCGKKINRGDRIFYYPRGKVVYCDAPGCGGSAERDFLTMAEAEDYYASGGRF